METELIVTFLAWFLGGFVNIITGIGGNLVALPVMLLALDFTVAAVVSCVIGALLGVMLVLRFYRLPMRAVSSSCVLAHCQDLWQASFASSSCPSSGLNSSWAAC